jgi:hypothetical protein
MELKKFQRDALAVIEKYLSEAAREKKRGNKHASLDVWETLGKVGYQEKKNGRGADVPNFVMKIPTGGGNCKKCFSHCQPFNGKLSWRSML